MYKLIVLLWFSSLETEILWKEDAKLTLTDENRVRVVKTQQIKSGSNVHSWKALQ